MRTSDGVAHIVADGLHCGAGVVEGGGKEMLGALTGLGRRRWAKRDAAPSFRLQARARVFPVS